MKLQNVKIGKRLVGGFAIFNIIIVLLCVISIKNMSDTNKKVDEMTIYNFEKTTLANITLVSLQVLTRETAKAVYTKDTAPFQVVGEMRKQYGAAMEKLEKIEINLDQETNIGIKK